VFLEDADHKPQAAGLRKRPYDLMAYGLFVASVTILHFCILPYAPETERKLIPFTGWGISLTYPFTLVFVAIALISTSLRDNFRVSIIALLALQIVLGTWQILSWPAHPDFGNPYLKVSPWRVVWVVLIPALWAIVLFIAAIPTIRRWIHYFPRRKPMHGEALSPPSDD
jgi:hypothetical protein